MLMTENPQYKTGDVVRLKSGGHDLTVTHCEIDESGEFKVWVVWFDDNMQPAEAVYRAAAVELVWF